MRAQKRKRLFSQSLQKCLVHDKLVKFPEIYLRNRRKKTKSEHTIPSGAGHDRDRGSRAAALAADRAAEAQDRAPADAAGDKVGANLYWSS